jgi:hypothetical protein
MKKKDLISVIIMGGIIIVALYFALSMLGVFGAPKSTAGKVTTTTSTQTNKPEFTGNIDENTLQKVNNLTNYGDAPLDNIGRVNPFGPLQ